MNKKIIAASVMGVLFMVASFTTVGYPFFFRGSVAEPSVEIDSGEGKVWLNSQIVLEFRGSLSEDSIRESLTISPNISVGKSDLRVEHIAAFPWHEGFPWAKTRATLNSDKKELFAPETAYTVSMQGEVFEFETITLPRVTDANSAEGAENVSVHDGIIGIRFNEEIVWEDHFITVEPQVDLLIKTHPTEKQIFVYPKEWPWKNDTIYKLTIKKDLKDAFDHGMREDFTFSFTTEPPVSVVEATPSGNTQKLDSAVKVVFDRAPLPKVAEESFVVTPKVEGKLTWADETSMVWTPAQKLPYSTEYVRRLVESLLGKIQSKYTSGNFGLRTHLCLSK